RCLQYRGLAKFSDDSRGGSHGPHLPSCRSAQTLGLPRTFRSSELRVLAGLDSHDGVVFRRAEPSHQPAGHATAPAHHAGDASRAWSAVSLMSPLIRWTLLLVLFVGCEAAPGRAAAPTLVQRQSSREEFVGPFASWTNVKTTYGAVGDGQTDDTTALQRALTELGTSGHSPVLFLPSGRYRITGTLTFAHQISLGVIGEAPDTTSIVWDGPRGGTMLLVNGIAYSRINRLTFDGRHTAAIAVDQSFDNTAPHFDTGNEYADDDFTDVEIGIRGGFKDFGFA